MLSKAELEAAVKKHGGIAPAARALKMNRSTLQRWLGGGKQGASITAPATPGKAVGRSIGEFRATYDRAHIVPLKIRAALTGLGPTGWDYEVPFAKLAGVSLADLGDFRDEFAVHIVVVRRDGKRAWAGTPALAEKMRTMIR